MSTVNFQKIIFEKKQKQRRGRPTQGKGGHSFIIEMAAFTWEMGYSFDNSRQIGNTSWFENGMVLILSEQSGWLYASILKMDYSFQIACVRLCTAGPSSQEGPAFTPIG